MMLMADEEMHLYMLLLVIFLVVYNNSIRDQNYLLCRAILDPKMSSWQHLMDNGDPSSFLLLTGLNDHAFNFLLDVLIPSNHHLHHHGR